MREQQVVLKHEADLPLLGGQLVDGAVADPDVAGIEWHDPGERRRAPSTCLRRSVRRSASVRPGVTRQIELEREVAACRTPQGVRISAASCVTPGTQRSRSETSTSTETTMSTSDEGDRGIGVALQLEVGRHREGLGHAGEASRRT